MKTICIVCGSSPGKQKDYTTVARLLAKRLVDKKITIVYGGSEGGLMGEVANSAMRYGGKVIGVITNDLLKKSEQVPTDQEQHFLIEDLYKTVEKMEETQEMNMTNKVNIEFLREQLDKALEDIERLKDKVRENGKAY